MHRSWTWRGSSANALAFYAVAVLGCLAGACSSDATDARYRDYASRVARVLELEVPDVSPPVLRPIPPPRAIRYELTRFSIDLIQFLQLHRCDLGALIGTRNSPLGRVMPPSERLLYEVAFLERVAPCMERAPAVREAVAETVATKRDELPYAVWNAAIASPELARFFSLDPAPGAASPILVAAAFDELKQATLDARALRVEPAHLKGALATLWRAGPFGGERQREWAVHVAWLSAVSGMLERAAGRGALCPQERPTPRAKVAHNVFTTIYGERVQPPFAEAHREDRQWVESLNALVAAQGEVRHPTFDAWFARTYAQVDGSLWSNLAAASRRHAKAWGLLLGPCGLAPGQAPRQHASA